MLNLNLHRFAVSVFVFTVCLNFSVSVVAYISNVEDGVVEKSIKVSPSAEELLRRRKEVESYLSEFEDYKKDWVETYHLKFKVHTQTPNKFDETVSSLPDETEPEIPSKEYEKTSSVPEDDTVKANAQKYPSDRDEKEGVVIDDSDSVKDNEPISSNMNGIFDEPSSKLHTVKCEHDRLYLIRWVTKLLHKIKNSEHGSICFSFTPDSLLNLEEISLLKDFDTVSTDEFVCSLISNATFHDGSYRINLLPSIDNFLFYFGIVLLVIFSIYFFHFFMKNHPYITLILLISTVFIYCHAHKHYKNIIAQKHATMSRVLPSNCVTTLTTESGVFDHIKEFIRHSFYDEDCKKYYEAVMIDPSVEVSIPVVIADLVASVSFQFLKPLASTLNYFVKEILSDLSFIQKLSLFPLFFFIFFILLLCFRYRIKLPFFLGSFEPSAAHVGSRAEDIKLENSGSPIVNVNIFPKKNNNGHCIHGSHAHGSLCSVEDKIEHLDPDIKKEEIYPIKYEEKIQNCLCYKHNLNENPNSCDQVLINSDNSAESNIDFIGDISDICSCKRCTEQIQCNGDKNEDDFEKQN